MIPEILGKIGIDKVSLDQSVVIEKHRWKVDIDYADGMKAGVRVTPTFFVNGQLLNEMGYQPLKDAVEKAIAESAND